MEIEARSLQGLEWPAVLEALSRRVKTAPGKSALAELAPFSRAEAAAASMALIGEVKTVVANIGPLPLPPLELLDGTLERARREGVLAKQELTGLLEFLKCTHRLHTLLTTQPNAPGITGLAELFHPEKMLTGTLERAFTAEGELNGTAYPELERLRRAVSSCREDIQRQLEGILKSERYAACLRDQIITLRGQRYCVPVKADFKGQLPGIVHDVSATGLTLFVEPRKIVEETNALMVLAKEVEAAEEAILRELSGLVGQEAPAILANQAWLGRVDFAHAQALLSTDWGAREVAIAHQPVLELKGLGHPLLLERGEPIVRNTVALSDPFRGILVSGVNAGGKTVLLKALGLCAWLARHGMHLPVSGDSKIGWFERVLADIGDQQNLQESLSTFTARIGFLAEAFSTPLQGSLVLLDEVLTGTDPGDGAGLAKVVLQALVDGGAWCVATTHYGELKHFAAEHPAFRNASMEFDPERMRPAYQLRMGLPGASYALDIARRHGLPEPFVKAAEAARSARPAEVEALLLEVRTLQRSLTEQEGALRKKEEDLEHRLKKFRHRQGEFETRQAALSAREQGQIAGEWEAARKKIAAIIHGLQKVNSLTTAHNARQALEAVSAEMQSVQTPRWQPGQTAATPPRPGSRVNLGALGRSGVLEALLDAGRRARVRMGPLVMEIDAAELSEAPPERKVPATGRGSASTKENPPAAQPLEGQAENTANVGFTMPTEQNTLDLRGLRVFEALEKTDAFLDHCMVKHITPVVLIHGHGTGRLKQGLREQLSESGYVRALRPGQGGEGRDGVTVVELNV